MMSDYSAKITNLYSLKSALANLKLERLRLPERPDIRELPRLPRPLPINTDRATQIQNEINAAIVDLYGDPLTDPLLQIEEANPLILLPLRLETRFANAGTELWIRVFPDEIAIDSHETALSASEIRAGKYYWQELWHKSNAYPSDLAIYRKKAWSQVANRFGVNRTNWILLKTRPPNLDSNEDFSKLTEAELDPGPMATRNQAWSEAAKSFVMPDLLKLRLYIEDKLVFEIQGNPIIQPLPVSPDPKSPATTAGLDWSATDIAWLGNFHKAVDAGMAFQIDLSSIPNYVPEQGFSLITVMGIRTLFDVSPLVEKPPIAGVKALSTLLTDHQYTSRGLALVSQGTPTNNTEEKRSGYADQPDFSEARYAQDQLQVSASTDPNEMEDGKILALALGLDPVLFQKLENSQDTDHRDAVWMNKALYPATLGFFLGHLLHPLFGAVQLDAIRSFFCSYVTGRGPIPAFRIGPQPYGILPTSNFKAFQWNAADKDYLLFQKLTALLTEVDAVYEAEIPNIAKLGQPKEPHVLLDEILELNANSETFYQRVGHSESFLRDFQLQSISGPPNPLLDLLIKTFSKYTSTAAEPEGILELKKLVWERRTHPLNRSRIVDLVATSESKTLSIPDGLGSPVYSSVNAIQWLSSVYLRTPLARLENDYYAGIENNSGIAPTLLYLLLKHSLLLQLYKCVFHWLKLGGYLAAELSIFHSGAPDSNFIASKEYLNFFQDRQDITPLELLSIEAWHLPLLSPGETAASYFLANMETILRMIRRHPLVRRNAEISLSFNYLNEFFPTLDYLANLSTARLERATIEHLDCLTYRLDAWQTGLFYKKLELNRSTGLATGIVLGAYGWLENLKPDANVNLLKESKLPAELRPGTGMPIIQADNHGGYIHAPSLTQAKTAALLRNAYLHHHDPADPAMMAVNLSSSRVRKALDVFEGIQKGHSIGELLGYRLERHLHDQSIPLDKYIPTLRREFPLGGKSLRIPGSQDQPSTTQPNIPVTWVARLDGLALVNATKAGNVYPFGLNTALPDAVPLPETGLEAETIQKGIDDLLDCIDAMKDLMVAESIYQIVQGNTDRAGALLKSINELKPPAKFEFVRTPRTPAEILTHRACVLFELVKSDEPVNPWPAVRMSQRALTEPGLNAWLAEIIGPPQGVQCTASDSEAPANQTVSIEDLDIQPIDLVYLVPMEFDDDASELSRRIAYHYRLTQDVREEVDVVIEYDKAEQDYFSLADLLPLLKLLKEVVTNSRALDAADFDLKNYPGKANFRNLSVENSGGTVDLGSLLRRKHDLTAALELLKKNLWSTANSESATCADIRQCLIECCDFDIRDAFPKSAVGDDVDLREALLLQTDDVLSQMEEMLATVHVAGSGEGELVQAITTLLGPAFKVLPTFHFALRHDNEVERTPLVLNAYNAESDIFSFILTRTNTSLEKQLENWLDEISYLRPKLATFDLVRLLYDSFQEKQLAIHVMQLPYEVNDSWLGLEFPAGMTVGEGKLSALVHHFPQQTSPDWKGSDFSGLLLDEWVEEIPDTKEVTGISFQYNQPNSQPPQALLLAISPTEGKNWDWDKLGDIIEDTLRRAKQRAVGTGDLAKTDWIGVLPGALAEFSATKANVSMFIRNW